MKQIILFIACSLTVISLTAQKIEIQDEKVLLDGKFLIKCIIGKDGSELYLIDKNREYVELTPFDRTDSNGQKEERILVNFQSYRVKAEIKGNTTNEDLVRILLQESVLTSNGLFKYAEVVEFCRENKFSPPQGYQNDYIELSLDDGYVDDLEDIEFIEVPDEDDRKAPIMLKAEYMPVFISECDSLTDRDQQAECTQKSITNFIQSNLVYPEAALNDSIQGRVFVEFIVDSEGRVGHVKVVKGLSTLLDTEAVRVINSLPVFRPAKQRGRPVQLKYTIPINFKLPEED